jgi:hypothetical protein
MEAALELAKRSAKKDDVILLIGQRFAAIEGESTHAQAMMETTGE